MIALVHGPDAALARAAVARLLAEHDPSGNNTTHLDGRGVTVPQIAAAVGSAAFFGMRRIVVVHDLMARAVKGATPSAEEGGERVAGGMDLAPLFSAVPSDNVLVLVDVALGTVPAAVKKVAPNDIVVVAGEPPRGGPLVNWLVRAASEAGGRLEQATAQYLAERLYPQTWATKPHNPAFDRPPNLELLGNEVAKLALAAYPDAIERRHVDELVAVGDDDRIFKFIEGATTGRVGPALQELERLLDAGEEASKLSAQVLQQVELIGALATARGEAEPIQVGRALGLPNPNRMTGIAGAQRGNRADAGLSALKVAVDVDRRAKRGELRDPLDALYALTTGSTETSHRPPARRSDGT